jgi:hypothetical protein
VLGSHVLNEAAKQQLNPLAVLAADLVTTSSTDRPARLDARDLVGSQPISTIDQFIFGSGALGPDDHLLARFTR